MTNAGMPGRPGPLSGQTRMLAQNGRAVSWTVGGLERSPWDMLVQDGSSSEGESVNISALLNVLRRHWKLVVGAMLVLTALSILIIDRLPPRYAAQAFLMLDTRKMQVVNIEAVMSGLSTDTAVIRSEVDVLHSPMLAGRVVDALDLEKNPQFNFFLLDRPGALQSWRSSVGDWLSSHAPQWLLLKWKEYWPSEEETAGWKRTGNNELTASQRRERLIDALLARLTVSNDGKSYGIRLTFEWEDPQIATSVVNTLAKLYIADQIAEKGDANRRANAWLAARLKELRDAVRKADTAVQAYRAEHRIFQGQQKGTTIAQQQLSELQSQLVRATVEEVQKESALRSRGGGPGGRSSDDVVLSSPLIQQLRTQEAEVARRVSSLREHFGPRHPDVIAAATELQTLRQRIQEETAKLVRGSSNDLEGLKAKVTQLRQAVAEAEQTVAAENAADVRLKELERESEANQGLYKNFLTRYLETSKQEDLQMADARIISLAAVPTRPAFPNKKLFIEVAVLISTMTGVALAFVVERFDPAFRRLDQLLATGCPGVGMLPLVRGAKRRPAKVADEIVHSPASAYSEAVRGIRNSLHTSLDQPLKSLLITSAAPGEGKTLFAVSAARSLVRSGRRVLLIDCDLRRPAVGRILGAQRQVDLQRLAAGLLELKSAVQVDEATGLHYIASRQADLQSNYYIDFMDSDHFSLFLEPLKATYDVVILDSPPVQAVSDAIVLARYVDAAVFLIQWGKTPRSVATTAIERLAATGVVLAGAVLSQVDLRRQAQYLHSGEATSYGHQYQQL